MARKQTKYPVPHPPVFTGKGAKGTGLGYHGKPGNATTPAKGLGYHGKPPGVRSPGKQSKMVHLHSKPAGHRAGTKRSPGH